MDTGWEVHARSSLCPATGTQETESVGVGDADPSTIARTLVEVWEVLDSGSLTRQLDGGDSAI